MKNTQINKKENLNDVVKLVAVTMPNGIENSKLIAFIEYDVGVTAKKAAEYLKVLEDIGKLELDLESKIWKIVATKKVKA
jgi:hypothetical protein